MIGYVPPTTRSKSRNTEDPPATDTKQKRLENVAHPFRPGISLGEFLSKSNLESPFRPPLFTKHAGLNQ